MKILLSYSKKHFFPENERKWHSTSILSAALWDVCKTMGEVDYIDWTDEIKGKEYDVLVTLPRHLKWLKENNKFGKIFCFPAIAESGFTKRTLLAESQRLGCKLSDCFCPDMRGADIYLIIGNDFVKQQYLNAGYKDEQIYMLDYGTPHLKHHKKTKEVNKTVFLHPATALGLRKGFWWAVNDFLKADLGPDAKLLCIGKIQHGEKFWYEFTKSISDPRIEIIDYADNQTVTYAETLNKAHFVFYPSFSEGQPGVVHDAMATGVVPILTEEAGIEYYPLGKYKRGETLSILRKAHEMNNQQYQSEVMGVRLNILSRFNVDNFKSCVTKAIKENL